MKLFTENCKVKGCVLVLGGFDGLHVGHRRLMERAKKEGVPVGVMTIVGGKEGALFTLSERLHVFETEGADFAVAFNFEEIRDKSAKDFLNSLEKEFAPILYVCGQDFRFGKGAEADADQIEKISNVPVAKEALVTIGGEKVATRHLKELLEAGRVDSIYALMGAPFFVIGEVVEGRKVGRMIGYPTANIPYPTDKMPLKEGVYSVNVFWKGKTYKGIANFGTQPTFGKMSVRLEVHIDNFDEVLYGETLKVEFLSYLRPVRKFGDLEELRAQLDEDIKKVRNND